MVERWSGAHSRLAEWLESALEDGLACFAFPATHRLCIRSTNGLERFNQELERRTRVARIFTNPDACLRLVTALSVEQSEEWLAGRVYLDMHKLEALDAETDSNGDEQATSNAA